MSKGFLYGGHVDPVALGWPDALPTKGVLRFDFVALGADARARTSGVGEMWYNRVGVVVDCVTRDVRPN